MVSGANGPYQEAFERGLRFLATALALQVDHRSHSGTVSSACDAIECFLVIFQTAAEIGLSDSNGQICRLRNQLEALLTPGQDVEHAAQHAVEAACLARDQAALLLPKLMEN